MGDLTTARSQFDLEADEVRANLVRLAVAKPGVSLVDAEDLAQETLLLALGLLDRFTPGTSLKAWTYSLFKSVHAKWVESRVDEISAGDAGAVYDMAERWAGPPPQSRLLAEGRTRTPQLSSSLPAPRSRKSTSKMPRARQIANEKSRAKTSRDAAIADLEALRASRAWLDEDEDIQDTA